MSGFFFSNAANDSSYALATWSSQSRKVTVVLPAAPSVSDGVIEQPASTRTSRAAASRRMGTSLHSGDGDRPDDVPLEDDEQDEQRQGGQQGGRQHQRPVAVELA